MTTYHCECGWTGKLRRGICPNCGKHIISSDKVKAEWAKYPKALTATVDADIARKKRKRQEARSRQQAERAKGGLAALRALRGGKEQQCD